AGSNPKVRFADNPLRADTSAVVSFPHFVMYARAIHVLGRSTKSNSMRDAEIWTEVSLAGLVIGLGVVLLTALAGVRVCSLVSPPQSRGS
ncbi:MAG: hypothetical protein ACM34E_09095, partial [Acidobacteriota bacterium]